MDDQRHRRDHVRVPYGERSGRVPHREDLDGQHQCLHHELPAGCRWVNAAGWQTGRTRTACWSGPMPGRPCACDPAHFLRPRHTALRRNVRIKDYPPRDIRTWQVYNALITDEQDAASTRSRPASSTTTPPRAPAGSSSWTTSLSPVAHPANGHRRDSFWYRNWETDGNPAATLRLASAPSAETPGSNWTDFCTISGITNTTFAFFKTNVYNTSHRFVRIYCETNPSPVRVALDNVLLTEPIAADFNLVDVHTIPEVPLYSDSVYISAAVTDKLLNPTNIQLQLAYYVGSNNWANWPSTNWIAMTNNGSDTYVTTEFIDPQEIDEVVQYTVIATYGGDVVESPGAAPRRRANSTTRPGTTRSISTPGRAPPTPITSSFPAPPARSGSTRSTTTPPRASTTRTTSTSRSAARQAPS